MAKVSFEFLNKNLTHLHEETVIDAPIPRVGEVIHCETNVDRNMAWYMVIDVRYSLKDSEVSTHVTSKAVSSDPHKGIEDARYYVLSELNWMTTD